MAINISVNPNSGLFDPKTGKMTREGFQLIRQITDRINDATSDYVLLTATQTLTNKTIDGDVNTLRDIATSSLKTKTGTGGSVVTASGAGTATKLAIWTAAGNVGDTTVTVDANGDMLASAGSISAIAADNSLSLGGNRAVMDFTSGSARFGSANGGGAATGLKLVNSGSDILTASAGGGITSEEWGSTKTLNIAIGSPTAGPGGNSFDGGIWVLQPTGDHQVCAVQVKATNGAVPEWGPISEFVAASTYDQGTNFARISLTAMGAYAGLPAGSDEADDFRIQMEAGGTVAMKPLHITSQYNTSGLVYFYQSYEADGNVRFFRRTDAPGVTADNLSVTLGQQARATANVLTANGQQDSPKLVWEGAAYDGSLHTSNFRSYNDVTSNAGAGTWLLDHRIDAGSWTNLIQAPSVGGVALRGTPTNDNAAAAYIGEYIESVVAVGSAVALTSGTVANVSSISLTAGDWDISTNTGFSPEATTSITRILSGFSLVSATGDTTAGRSSSLVFAAVVPGANANLLRLSNAPYRLSLNATTTVYHITVATFTVANLSAFGIIRARRVR